ncbi:Peroxidasin-like protein [Harpegnathos saltator]|uniref:Peroxidasin-like protein n=2 Tax=Harpegnathos saltator TaxID=610380 RepID=E2BAM2_HARSA|nr:Peroxidasin-like protein [Harpegnathos saltator]
MEAANFGLRAMHNLYYVQEPKLYSMGLYLKRDEPARYVAAFNDQSEEARNLARFGYATLQGTAMYMKKFPGAPLELPLSRSTRRTSLEQQCPRRGTPQCPPASLRYRTSDGSCNNLRDLWWGSAMSTMQRFLPAIYHDGVQSVRRSTSGRPLPSPRDISGLIHEDQDIPLASVTHMLMQWGQFVDHDLTATGQSRGFNGTVPQCCLPGGAGFQPPEFMHPECLPIAVSLRDSFYGPLGVRCLEFLRSGPAPKEGCEFGPREQLSQVTSYLDASMVYSSNALQSDSLRLFRSGLLQYGRIQSLRRPPLPKRESDLCKLGSLSTTCFRAGDGRLSEQPALTSLHVVFLRLHNRIATELSALNSHWSDEKLFQETRRIVGAVVQHITYREFLPIILGPQVMRIFDLEVLKKGYYEGYDSTVNPNIANAFSTAAYRFGHSLVQRSFVRFDSDHRPLFNNVSIHDEFRNPVNLETAGSVDRLVLGLANQPCQRRDEFITEEVTNHLFQTPGFAFGMDLASLNIQRGRDHGLPPYVRWREPCGLSPIRTFEDLDRVMSPSTMAKFRSLYSSVEDIDLFPAGLAERSVVGGLVGPTFACIIGQQFSNLRRGDRFWYENPESESSFTAGQLQQIRRVTLAQVLCKTLDTIETIQPFVFLATDTLKNRRLSCEDPTIGQLDLEFWAERSFRHNVDDPQTKTKRTASDSLSVSRSKEEKNTNIRRQSNREQITLPQKPFTSSIHQSNKIVVKRPIGRPENVSIVVHNNAVSAPVFVNDGIYGSNIRIRQQPTVKPTSAFNQGVSNYPVHRPPTKPIPTTIPHSAYLYVPQAYNDPNNPNPLVYGYKSPVSQSAVFYDNYSPSSPRPTLYTYYTNFQQKPTTQTPNHEVDGYLLNYGSPHHEQDSFPAHHAYDRPKPGQVANSGHPYEPNTEQRPPQKPSSKPSYESSNDESYHKPGYSGLKPPTISRPSFGSNDQPYHGQNSDYLPSRPRPTSASASRPSDQSYDTQNGRPSEDYSANSNQPQRQDQWNLNGHHKRPYDYDDPDAYQKRPKPQSGPYANSGTNIPSHPQEDAAPSNSYWQGSTLSNNYGKYPDATLTYQSSTPAQNEPFESHSSSFYQKPTTSRPVYQEGSPAPYSSPYPKESIDKPLPAANLYEETNSYKNPNNPNEQSPYRDITHQSRPTPTTYWSEVSTLQMQKQEGSLKPRPIKVQSVTIVTEAVETVHHPGHSGYISQYKVTSEVPMPLKQQTKTTNVPVLVRKPGQYYYEKNVLHRYSGEGMLEQIPKSNHHYSTDDNVAEETLAQDRGLSREKIAAEATTDDSITNVSVADSKTTEREESKSTTTMTSTLVTTSGYDINGDDVVDDLEGAFSAVVGNVASLDVPDRMSHWVNTQEDPNLSSMIEMPGILSDESASAAKELPKPIKSGSHAA